MTDKPLIEVRLFVPEVGKAVWRCTCGYAGSALTIPGSRGRGHRALVALEVAKTHALDHVETAHPLHTAAFRLMTEDATP